jgi:chorismate mutase
MASSSPDLTTRMGTVALAEPRKQLDALTEQLAILLMNRRAIAETIARIKVAHKLPLANGTREGDVQEALYQAMAIRGYKGTKDLPYQLMGLLIEDAKEVQQEIYETSGQVAAEECPGR